MSEWLLVLLLAVFLTHLVVFAVLGLRRRQWYYLALVITFLLLSASVSLRLIAPTASMGATPWHLVLRWSAWLAAAVSVPWTVARIYQRKR